MKLELVRTDIVLGFQVLGVISIVIGIEYVDLEDFRTLEMELYHDLFDKLRVEGIVD